MTELTLSVPDISCDHCKMSIEGAVNELAGVDSAIVDIEGKSVAVAFNDAAVNRDSIVDAIESQGYEVAAN
jgi:copper chaperone